MRQGPLWGLGQHPHTSNGAGSISALVTRTRLGDCVFNTQKACIQEQLLFKPKEIPLILSSIAKELRLVLLPHQLLGPSYGVQYEVFLSQQPCGGAV